MNEFFKSLVVYTLVALIIYTYIESYNQADTTTDYKKQTIGQTVFVRDETRFELIERGKAVESASTKYDIYKDKVTEKCFLSVGFSLANIECVEYDH
jgi:hypothetical protein